MTACSLSSSPNHSTAILRIPTFFLAAVSIKAQLPQGDEKQKQNNNEVRSKQSQNPARSGRSFTPPVLHKEQGCDQAQSRKSLLNNLKVKSTSKVTQQVSDTAGGSTQLSVKEDYLI